MGNSDILKELVEREVKVQLPTGEIVLTAPSEVAVIAMHNLAQKKDSDSEENAFQNHFETTARAIAACTGVDFELAKKALMMSGGVAGELASESMRMCGFGRIIDRTEEELQKLNRPT